MVELSTCRREKAYLRQTFKGIMSSSLGTRQIADRRVLQKDAFIIGQ
jgi:hypothetical protein